MKFQLTYSEARAAVERVITGLPSGDATKIVKPARMFDTDTLEPLDLVAMAMVEAGFDPTVLREDSPEGEDARIGNEKHMLLTGYRYFFYQDNPLFGGPNHAVKCYFGHLAMFMDRGIPAWKAHVKAQRWVQKIYDRDAFQDKERSWGIDK